MTTDADAGGDESKGDVVNTVFIWWLERNVATCNLKANRNSSVA